MLLVLVNVIFVLGITAQNEKTETPELIKSKKGYVIQPEVGDFSISADATPFLNYLGNIFNVGGNTAPYFTFSAQNPAMIGGKYIVSENKAYRFAARFGYNNNVDLDGNGIDPDEKDKYKASALRIDLMAGIEKSRTIRNRIRAYYGYEAIVGITPFSGMSEFGGDVTGNLKFVDGSDDTFNRSEYGGNQYSFGGAGLVGVEYFVAPKIALGGEFKLGLSAYYESKRVIEMPNNQDTEYVLGGYGFDLDNAASGSIFISIYF